MFFTTDFEAAAAYALNCSVPDDCDYEMAVLAVDVDEAVLEELDAADFRAQFGSDGRHSSESWQAAANYAYELSQRSDRAGILIRGCLDYGGQDFETKEIFDRRYDQVVLASPDRYPIVERIQVPADFAIRKARRRPRMG